MPQIKYHYAFDEDGHIVNINEVVPQERRQHSYRCIGCGAPMVAKMGPKRADHFAHGVETEGCGTETYLHQLGKHLLKEKFYSDGTFSIAYHREVTCSNKGSCLFYADGLCKQNQLETFNLKEYYDTCEEEKAIGDFRADLLLSSSTQPSRKPILLEIQVTHESEPQKIDTKKKLHIIEMRVKDEADIFELVQKPLTEHPDHTYVRDVDTVGFAKFYGFKRKSSDDRPLSLRHITRFCLYSNGSAYIPEMEDTLRCHQQDKRLYRHTILELNFEPPTEFGVSIYNLGYVYAYKKGELYTCCPR